ERRRGAVLRRRGRGGGRLRIEQRGAVGARRRGLVVARLVQRPGIEAVAAVAGRRRVAEAAARRGRAVGRELAVVTGAWCFPPQLDLREAGATVGRGVRDRDPRRVRVGRRGGTRARRRRVDERRRVGARRRGLVV